MNLANELLPPLPQGTISLPVSSSFFMKGSLPKKGQAGSSSKPEDSNGKIQEVSNREKLLNDQPELLQHFGMDLLPVLVQVGCQSTAHLIYSSTQTLKILHHFLAADLWLQCQWSCSPQVSFSYRKTHVFQLSRNDPVFE